MGSGTNIPCYGEVEARNAKDSDIIHRLWERPLLEGPSALRRRLVKVLFSPSENSETLGVKADLAKAALESKLAAFHCDVWLQYGSPSDWHVEDKRWEALVWTGYSIFSQGMSNTAE